MRSGSCSDRDRANAAAKAFYAEDVRRWRKLTIALFIVVCLVDVAVALLYSRKLVSAPLGIGGGVSIHSLLLWSKARYRMNERLLHLHLTLMAAATLSEATAAQKDRILNLAIQAVGKPGVVDGIKALRRKRDDGAHKPGEPAPENQE
jgi:hypothetical protein